jgi:HAD superfamily hydrolase (TIGR01509 family)
LSTGRTAWPARSIRAIIFDVDGTLTDSIESYYEVFRRAMEKIGVPVNREQVLNPMAFGLPIWEWAIPREIANREEKVRECKKLIPGIFAEVFSRVRPFAGLEEVLRKLSDRGIRLGAATSSWFSAVQPLYDHALAHYFGAFVTREDGFPLKPAPDSILECLRKMGGEAHGALTVGDTPLDIRAGKAAGTYTCAVLSGIGTREQLEAEYPTLILEGVGQILSALELG